MKKFLLMVMVLTILFSASLQASRSSDDIVTATNSAFNNYIQDVIGNKDDKAYGNSMVSMIKGSTNAIGDIENITATNLEYSETNMNRNSLLQRDALTNVNRNGLIQLITATNLEYGETNMNRNSLLQRDALTNVNRNGLIQLIVATNREWAETNMNRNSLIQSDGITNEKLIRTNQNRIDQDRIVGQTNANRNALIQLIVATNREWAETNMNRNALIQAVGDTNEAQQDVPGADSVNNTHVRDVIGNKTDTYAGSSIYAMVETLADHAHSESKMYPTQAAGTTIAAAGTAWSITNNFTNTIVPATTITDPFDIHYISIENISANAVYELVLYNMTTKVEIGRCRFVRNAQQDGTVNVPMQTPIQAANSKIGGNVASSTAVNDTVTISLFYHTY